MYVDVNITMIAYIIIGLVFLSLILVLLDNIYKYR